METAEAVLDNGSAKSSPPHLPQSAEEFPINSVAVGDLYERAQRPAQSGQANRVTLTYTITPQTDNEWRDFLQTQTGTSPIRGKGISSPMVELAMQMLMAVVADFRIDEVATHLREISASDMARQNLKANLVKLAEQL